MAKKPFINRDMAENVAISGLSWIASDPELLGRFLALTGLGPASIRTAAQDPAFLAAVLEFLSADDSAILTFAANRGFDPVTVAAARDILASAPREEP